jgi:protein-disulfide isomerase
MRIPRRSVIAAATAAIATPFLPRAGRADTDARLTERSLGSASAPVTVTEYFSLTCPHCARFARDVLPRVQKELIDTGKLRWVFRDYPLDQVALTAAMIARTLPASRYEPFVDALLASQDRWAFARGVNSTDELAKMAALAGMSRATFQLTQPF